MVLAWLALVLSVLRVNGTSYQFRPYWNLGNVEMFEPVGFIYTDIDETFRLYLRAHPTPFGLLTVSSPDLVQWSEPELVGLNAELRPNMMPVASFLAEPGDYEAHHLFVDNDTFVIAKDQPLCHGWDLNITLEIPMGIPLDWKLTSYFQIEQKTAEFHVSGDYERMDVVVHYDPVTNWALGWRLKYSNGEFTKMDKVMIFMPTTSFRDIQEHFDEDGGQGTFARFGSQPVHRTACSYLKCDRADMLVFQVTGNGTDSKNGPPQKSFHFVGNFDWFGLMGESPFAGVYEEYSDFYGLDIRHQEMYSRGYDGELTGLSTGRYLMDGLGQDLTPPAMLWNPPTEEHRGLSVSTDVLPLQPTNSIGFWYRQRARDGNHSKADEQFGIRYHAGIWTDFYRKLGCAYHAESSFGPGNSHNYLNAEDAPPHMMMVKSKTLPISYSAGWSPYLGNRCADCPEEFLPRMPLFGSRCVDCPEPRIPSLSIGGPSLAAFDNAACDLEMMEYKVYLWDQGATGYSGIDTEWDRFMEMDGNVNCGYLQSSQYGNASTHFEFLHESNETGSFAREIEFYVMPPYDPNGKPQTCGPLPDEWPDCTESSDGTCFGTYIEGNV